MLSIKTSRVPTIPSLLEMFIMKGRWVLSNASAASIAKMTCILLFGLRTRWVTWADFPMLTRPCVPEINPAWSWSRYRVLFISTWVRFATTSLRTCVSQFMGAICSSLYLYCLYQVVVSLNCGGFLLKDIHAPLYSTS